MSSTRDPAFADTGRPYYAIIVASFVCLLLVSNIAATKGIQLGPFITDGGALLFPLTYVLGDALAEVYGFRATRRAIFLGFAASLVASLTFWLVMIAPGAPGYENQGAFEAVLGVVPRILLASMLGYLAGQMLNALVLVAIKRRTRERHLWARLLGSTLVGEAADTVVFCAIAAGAIGIQNMGQFWNYVLVGYVYKVAIEVLALPLTYRLVAFLKGREPSYASANGGTTAGQ
ncbi:MAG: queuosine precursor transporter [bacterium]|nr:queuosine precursor transporter [bacterium]